MTRIEKIRASTIRNGIPILKKDPTNEWVAKMVKAAMEKDDYMLKLLVALKYYPVDVETFLFHPDYLGVAREEVFPRLLWHIKRICDTGSSPLTPSFSEAVLTGGIGTGKTTLALYICAYQLYVLSCFINPQKSLGQDSMSEIVMVFQSLQGKKAKDVPYSRFRSLLTHSKYFTEVYKFRTDIESELRFPDRITVKPVGGDAEGTIGENVIGGFIDEVNFMDVTQDSKRTHDAGEYDQAKVIYNSISRRRESRFMEHGATPGILCLGSSKNYPGEFTDRKIDEAKTNPRIYIFEERVWNIMPWKFGKETFPVFVGDATRQPLILTEKETKTKFGVEDQSLIMRIPEEFRLKFELDIMNSLREIAGIATRATHPFIPRTDLVSQALGTHQNIFSRDEVDFSATQLKIYPKRFAKNQEPRFACIDLGVTSDSAGLCIGHVQGFKDIDRGGGLIERLPDIYIDGVLRIRPPKGGEINFEKIRNILYTLRNLGMPIKWVSLDSFQSVDTIQLLKQKGFFAGNQSMDKTMLPYDFTKSAIYDGRLSSPAHEKMQIERVSLEKIIKSATSTYVDHPPNGSKDVSDALAGVVYGLTMRRELWSRWGVSINEHLLDQVRKSDKNIAGEAA